jgi:transcriptional regulator with XRE-family HTH domain
MSTDDAPPGSRSAFPGFDELDEDVAGIVRRLTEHRRAAGLSQSDVAGRMRTSQSAVARLEANRGDLRLSTLERYAQALGLTMRFGATPVARDITSSAPEALPAVQDNNPVTQKDVT